ncbi:hypothetical protein ACWY4P_34880 [Streptomyces sp. LZ34]
MRMTLRRLSALALGSVALLGLPAPSAGAEGLGEIPGLYGVDQAARCRTSPAIGTSGLDLISATGEDTYSTACGNVANRDRVKQRLECRTDPANVLVSPKADRKFNTGCSNTALDGGNRDDHQHEDRRGDRYSDRRGY